MTGTIPARGRLALALAVTTAALALPATALSSSSHDPWLAYAMSMTKAERADSHDSWFGYAVSLTKAERANAAIPPFFTDTLAPGHGSLTKAERAHGVVPPFFTDTLAPGPGRSSGALGHRSVTDTHARRGVRLQKVSSPTDGLKTTVRPVLPVGSGRL